MGGDRRCETIQIEGCTLAYEWSGEPRSGGDVTVFLHGFGMDRRWMRDLAWRTTGDQCAVLVDLRGHGETFAPKTDGAHSYLAMRDDLVALADSLDARRLRIVGHSMGGQVGLLVAEQLGRRVRSLVAISAGPCRTVVDAKERAAWERAAAAYDEASRSDLVAMLDKASPWIPRDRTPVDPALLYAAARGDDLARIVRGGFLRVDENDNACRSLSLDSLVIAGARDEHWLEPSRKLSRLIPRSHLRVVPDAGHLAYLEHAKTIARLIREFWEQDAV